MMYDLMSSDLFLSRLTIHHSRFYSVLKLFTGFAIAAFIACRHTVSNAIKRAIAPAITNTHHVIEIL